MQGLCGALDFSCRLIWSAEHPVGCCAVSLSGRQKDSYAIPDHMKVARLRAK